MPEKENANSVQIKEMTQNEQHTAKADEDVVKDGASVGVELFEVFVLACRRFGFHRLKVDVVVDKTLESDVLTPKPRKFPQLKNPHSISNNNNYNNIKER